MDGNKNLDYLSNLFSFISSMAKDEAESLSNSFGSLNYIFHIDEYTLVSSSGCNKQTAEFIRLVAALTSRRITDKFKFGKKYSQKEIEEYICGLFLGLTVETVYILLFDKEGKFISSDYLGDGTVNSSGFLPRKMLDVALRKNAASVILAHSHPLGTTVPSKNDIFTTSLAKSVLFDAGITLLSHYIVSGMEIADCLSETKESSAESYTAFGNFRKRKN